MHDSLPRWRFAALAVLGLVVAICLVFLVRDVLRSPAKRAAAPAEAAFVGRAACAKCHAAESAAWAGSHHDRAMTEAGDPREETVRGDFSGVRFEGDGMRARFFRDGAKYAIETDGPDGKPAVYEVAYTFGWEPLQQYLVRFPGGRLQAFPVAWDTARRRWFFLYPGKAIPPTDWLHWTRNAQNWNGMCADCHSTHLVKGYDPKSDSYTTTWSEIDVSCEACHGPSSRHVAWAGAAAAGGAPYADNGLVVKTSGIGNRAQVELCAPCHARRTELGDYDHRSSELFENLLPSLLDEGLYHPDGQILDEDFEYGSFVQSKMFAMGVRCTHCHEPHSLKLRQEGNGVCLQCHPAPAFDDARHHFHKKEWQGKPSAGALCVSCHMPKSPFMVVHMRADHSIRIPRPDLTQAIGVPNACASSGCHADKPGAWINDAYDRWYGKERPPHYGTTFAAARRGDPAAKPELLRLAADRSAATIVRATALSLLGRYDGADVTAAFRAALVEDEPLMRETAAAAPIADETERALRLAPLLGDSQRAVRLEAAAQLAGIPASLLRPEQQAALATATADYVKAMEHALDFTHGGHNLGLLYERQGDVVRAEESYRRALAVDDLAVGPKVNLALLLARQGRNPEAEQLLREVVATNPEAAEAAYSLGLLLAESGRMEEAATFLVRAADAMPGDARAAYNAGLALAQAGRFAEAEATLRRAVEIDPASYDLLFALADILLRQGGSSARNEIAALADRMASLDPRRPEAEQLRLWLAGRTLSAP